MQTLYLLPSSAVLIMEATANISASLQNSTLGRAAAVKLIPGLVSTTFFPCCGGQVVTHGVPGTINFAKSVWSYLIHQRSQWHQLLKRTIGAVESGRSRAVIA